MKMFLRLFAVCLIPGLMFVFLNAALAGPPVAKSHGGSIFAQPWTGRAPANRGLLQAQPVSGLSVTHTSPVFASIRAHFTATLTGGTSPNFAWSFGDGTPILSGPASVISHTYAAAGAYTVVVTAFNFLNSVSQNIAVTVIEPPFKAQLPIIFKNFTTPIEPGELSCKLSIDPPAPTAGNPVVVSVQLQNQLGNPDGFWVDLYINPSKVPSGSNLFPWQQACGNTSPCRGIAWAISNSPLGPGITRTLVSIPKNFHPNGFDPDETSWTGSLPAGTYDLYAYADSIDNPVLKDVDGAVPEPNEGNNRCQILDLVIPAGNPAAANEGTSNPLPVRPTP